MTIDAEEGIAKISGEVDPNMLLPALGSGGRHAELNWVNLKSPAPNRAYYDHGYSSYNYGHDYRTIEQPYWGRRLGGCCPNISALMVVIVITLICDESICRVLY